ncbi:LysR family transcriptional regulator [Pseudogulbenkiania subflava]|uniref:DNA-binding transcriptional regulator, LysR family n=1 Tax=Pseudogulbenkiania subflava DSM 22618 TaxID=1123014 RepID=A0A1Y6BGV6_9NEIS|nr:LysR family transcriptional regulator [Pseudogulbenkiania subflava]SMF02906.1 DNA-binding transcriptional regulator, LysR family [Pseudogulbenkiania subflava DSM 22618]
MTLKLTLRELAVFVAVADCATVTRAADTLAMTQSAASQALASLESGLAAALFDRVGRRLLLNEHGRLLLPRARALLDQAQELQGLFSGGAIDLRLGASTTVANYLLPERIAAFRLAHPQARVELEVANTRDIVEAVAAFRVDAGFIEGPCHHPELVVMPWLDDELVPFCAAGHPLAGRVLTLEELAAAPWLLREPGSGTREEVERLLLAQLGRVNLVMELGNSEALKRAVAAGLGVSCLSRRVIDDLLRSGSVVELATALPRLMRRFHRIVHRDKTLTQGLSQFLDMAAY